MFGFVKCEACGKRFRRKGISLVCPKCNIMNYCIQTAPPITGTSELDNAQRKIRQAQLEKISIQDKKRADMEEQIKQWQQLNNILYDPKSLSASEIAKYKRMRKDLEKSDAVRAHKRPPTRADRKRDEAID